MRSVISTEQSLQTDAGTAWSAMSSLSRLSSQPNRHSRGRRDHLCLNVIPRVAGSYVCAKRSRRRTCVRRGRGIWKGPSGFGRLAGFKISSVGGRAHGTLSGSGRSDCDLVTGLLALTIFVGYLMAPASKTTSSSERARLIESPESSSPLPSPSADETMNPLENKRGLFSFVKRNLLEGGLSVHQLHAILCQIARL